MPKRPNILLIVTDQQSYHALQCMGNPWLETPSMDALAARGMLFERAYCSYPLCGPARTTQMTGKYAHEYGVLGNSGKFFWYENIPREDLMGYYFAQAGYECVGREKICRRIMEPANLNCSAHGTTS